MLDYCIDVEVDWNVDVGNTVREAEVLRGPACSLTTE
jgi:hypothetical protein